MTSIEKALELIPHDRAHEIVSSSTLANHFDLKRDKDHVQMIANTTLALDSEPVRLFVNAISKTVADMKANPAAVVSVTINHLDNHKTLQINVIEKPSTEPEMKLVFARSSFYSNINGKQSFGQSYTGPSSAFLAEDVASQIHKQLKAHGQKQFSIEAFVQTPEKQFLDDAEAGFLISAAMFNEIGDAVIMVENGTPRPFTWVAEDVESLLREAQPSKSLRGE